MVFASLSVISSRMFGAPTATQTDLSGLPASPTRSSIRWKLLSGARLQGGPPYRGVRGIHQYHNYCHVPSEPKRLSLQATLMRKGSFVIATV